MRTLPIVLAAVLAAAPQARAAGPGDEAAPPAPARNAISKVSVGERGDRVVVSIAGSAAPSFTTFALEAPPRFVVDLADATLKGVPARRDLSGTVVEVQALELKERVPVARIILTFAVEVEPPELVAVGNVLEVRVPRLPAEALAAAEPPPAPAAEAEPQLPRMPAPAPVAEPAPAAAAPKLALPSKPALPTRPAVRPAPPRPAPAADRLALAKPSPEVKSPRPMAPPGARASHAVLLRIEELGFHSTPDVSTVFVRTSAAPRFSIASEGERTLRVELRDTVPGNPNQTRALDTRFFPGAVASVVPSRHGRSTVLDIALKEQVAYSQRVEGDTLSIDFASPGTGAGPGAADVEPAPSPESPAEATPPAPTP